MGCVTRAQIPSTNYRVKPVQFLEDMFQIVVNKSLQKLPPERPTFFFWKADISLRLETLQTCQVVIRYYQIDHPSFHLRVLQPYIFDFIRKAWLLSLSLHSVCCWDSIVTLVWKPPPQNGSPVTFTPFGQAHDPGFWNCLLLELWPSLRGMIEEDILKGEVQSVLQDGPFLLGWWSGWLEDGGWWRFVFVCGPLGPKMVFQNCEQRFSSFFLWHLLLVKWSLIKRWMELRSVSILIDFVRRLPTTSEQKCYHDSQKPCKSEFWRGIVKGSGWGSFQNRWSWRDSGPPKTKHSKRVRDWWQPPKLTWLAGTFQPFWRCISY